MRLLSRLQLIFCFWFLISNFWHFLNPFTTFLAKKFYPHSSKEIIICMWRWKSKELIVLKSKLRLDFIITFFTLNNLILSSVFTPFIFFSHQLFFFWGKIVFNIKRSANFFRCFSFDHICNCFACQIKKWFNIKIVSRLKRKVQISQSFVEKMRINR